MIVIQLALRMNFIHTVIFQQDKKLFSQCEHKLLISNTSFLILTKVAEEYLQVSFYLKDRSFESLYTLKLIGYELLFSR